ncbi:MAG: hypothetical protein AB8B69_16035 [Chitinophagales bacterium]
MEFDGLAEAGDCLVGNGNFLAGGNNNILLESSIASDLNYSLLIVLYNILYFG